MSGTHMAAISKSKIKIPKIQNFQVALAHMAPDKTLAIQPWVMGIRRGNLEFDSESHPAEPDSKIPETWREAVSEDRVRTNV